MRRGPLDGRRIGQDLLVTITGGDRPHIGAAALGHRDAPGTVLTLAGHRETDLALDAVERLRPIVPAGVLVSCGIHVDGAGGEEIRILCDEAHEVIEALAQELRGIV